MNQEGEGGGGPATSLFVQTEVNLTDSWKLFLKYETSFSSTFQRIKAGFEKVFTVLGKLKVGQLQSRDATPKWTIRKSIRIRTGIFVYDYNVYVFSMHNTWSGCTHIYISKATKTGCNFSNDKATAWRFVCKATNIAEMFARNESQTQSLLLSPNDNEQ